MSNRATMPSGAIVDFWDAQAVDARLRDCADTLRRLRVHGALPAEYGSSWPDMIRDFWDAFGWNDIEIKPAPPTAEAITRMDQTMIWFLFIGRPADRRIAWAKAFRLSDRKIARVVGQSRWTVQRRYRRTLSAIVDALNSGAIVYDFDGDNSD